MNFTMLSRSFSALTVAAVVSLIGPWAVVVNAQSCPSGNQQACAFEPTNPLSCGKEYSCGYPTICHAETAGFDIDEDCCQAPQPSQCIQIFDPVVCGSKSCPYPNTCVASLAGYSDKQCSPPPPTCPVSSRNCSGEPTNPFTCGQLRCPYQSICEAEGAGFNVRSDCCQDTRMNSACSFVLEPVSCGPPGGKQCGYDSQCLADAAGYNENQCCPSVPEGGGVGCPYLYQPVQCGKIPCVYSNQCEAGNAGWDEMECCRQVPPDTTCPRDYDPVLCGRASCEYQNSCLANVAGFDFNSCVPAKAPGPSPVPRPTPTPPTTPSTTYWYSYDAACRIFNNRGEIVSGEDRQEYRARDDMTEEECEYQCNSNSKCTGYEYTWEKMRCEIWKVPIDLVQYKPGVLCAINPKFRPGPTPSSAADVELPEITYDRNGVGFFNISNLTQFGDDNDLIADDEVKSEGAPDEGTSSSSTQLLVSTAILYATLIAGAVAAMY